MVAILISGGLCAISLAVPPGMYSDSGFGFLAWRGTLLGAVNSVVAPDPANIALDTATFQSMWSPGQYLLPGIVSLVGIPIGTAISITVGLSLLCCLIGWARIVEKFCPGPRLPLAVVVAVGLFRYSTLPFGMYNGGEILLQAATPWLIMAAMRVPGSGFVYAFCLAAAAVLLAFVAKLTGLIVVAGALGAAAITAYRRDRRITRGMIGGAIGSWAVFALEYGLFIARGASAATEISSAPKVESVAFATLIPWESGLSWTDMALWIFENPSRAIFVGAGILLAFALPVAALIAGAVLSWRPQSAGQSNLKMLALWFYGITTAMFVLLYVHGASISLEERHFRSAGTLLFACALIALFGERRRSWLRPLLAVVCMLMIAYGTASLGARVWRTARAGSLDEFSRTNQSIVDIAAIDYLRDAYARDGGRSLFVVPSPDIAVALPLQMRVLGLFVDFTPEPALAALRYSGRVGGHVCVMLQNNLAATAKGHDVLAAFIDYPIDGWHRKTFAGTSVFCQ